MNLLFHILKGPPALSAEISQYRLKLDITMPLVHWSDIKVTGPSNQIYVEGTMWWIWCSLCTKVLLCHLNQRPFKISTGLSDWMMAKGLTAHPNFTCTIANANFHALRTLVLGWLTFEALWRTSFAARIALSEATFNRTFLEALKRLGSKTVVYILRGKQTSGLLV